MKQKSIEFELIMTDEDNPCESCYFEDVCMQTEHIPKEILECESNGTIPGYWRLMQ